MPSSSRLWALHSKQGAIDQPTCIFGTAKKQHVLKHGALPSELEVVMADTLRSVERGLGPSKLKDCFRLEDLTAIDLDGKSPEFRVRYHMVILGCHFLTREIELSATLRKHLTVDTTKQIVTWTLPVSKTDTRGQLIARSHKCLCNWSHPQLCPYHSAVEVLKLTKALQMEDMDGPLFSENFQPMTKQYAIDCIRQVLKAAALPTTREGVQGQVEMFHGHSLRVSGAQYLTRLGLSTTLVMLLGRWGSQAIMRYIQDSPLQELLQARGVPNTASGSEPAPREVHIPRDLESEPAFKKLKADQAEVNEELGRLRVIHKELVEDMARINYVPAYVVGKKTHLPDPREKHFNPRSWTTKCGWSYGMTKFRRTDESGDQCKKCFNIDRNPDQVESGEDTPSSSSSDSS